jgi:hypothetical protein
MVAYDLVIGVDQSLLALSITIISAPLDDKRVNFEKK